MIHYNVVVERDGHEVFRGHNDSTGKGTEWILRRVFDQSSTLGAKNLGQAQAWLIGPSTFVARARAAITDGAVAGQSAVTIAYSPTTDPLTLVPGDALFFTIGERTYNVRIVSISANASGTATMQVAPRIPSSSAFLSGLSIASRTAMTKSATDSRDGYYVFEYTTTAELSPSAVWFGYSLNEIIAVVGVFNVDLAATQDVRVMWTTGGTSFISPRTLTTGVIRNFTRSSSGSTDPYRLPADVGTPYFVIGLNAPGGAVTGSLRIGALGGGWTAAVSGRTWTFTYTGTSTSTLTLQRRPYFVDIDFDELTRNQISDIAYGAATASPSSLLPLEVKPITRASTGVLTVGSNLATQSAPTIALLDNDWAATFSVPYGAHTGSVFALAYYLGGKLVLVNQEVADYPYPATPAAGSFVVGAR